MDCQEEAGPLKKDPMKARRLHYVSGLTFAIFIGLHLFNHVLGVSGAENHIEMMTTLRYFYRNILVETIFLGATIFLLISGLSLVKIRWGTSVSFFEKLHVWSGLYLAFFLLVHIGAVLGARWFLKLDTNFYFGAAGLNTFPFNLFFVPYYSLAILAFFAHLASIHKVKMKHRMLGLSPKSQSLAILMFGVCITGAILVGLTNSFEGIDLPEEYDLYLLMDVIFEGL